MGSGACPKNKYQEREYLQLKRSHNTLQIGYIVTHAVRESIRWCNKVYHHKRDLKNLTIEKLLGFDSALVIQTSLAGYFRGQSENAKNRGNM